MLVAVLVGTLFLPVGSLGITPLIEQAQASTAISTALMDSNQRNEIYESPTGDRISEVEH
jgi:hypothetical protein